MKKFLFILILACQFASSQSFESGNELYKQEKYPEAIDAYQKVLKSQKHSAELYFNLGNSYYKINKIAPSIYYFEKALLLSPGDAEIENNLKFAQKLMVDEVKEPTKAGFGKILGDITSTFHYNTWAWIAISLASGFLLLFAVYYFSASTVLKRIFFFAMAFVLLLVILSVVTAFYERSRFINERPAIVFEGIAPVKSEPKPSASDVVVVHEGTKVYVLETLEGWKKVLLPDGNDGWIESAAIKEIK